MASSSDSGNRFILTGGGTGGHTYPALAIAEAIRRRLPDAEFLYIGARGRAEERIVPLTGIPLRLVPAVPFPGGRNPLRLFTFAIALASGVLRAAAVILRYEPRAVIGTGGYASAPAVFAAWLLRRAGLIDTRIYIHEQNVVLGRMNQVAARLADAVFVSFPGTLGAGRFVLTGYPVRQEIFERAIGRREARDGLGLPAEATVVAAFGGSGGARTINRAVVEMLPGLLADPAVRVVHACGTAAGAEYHARRDTEARLAALELPPEQASRYRLVDYFDEIWKVYAAADVVVTRAGAGTISEVRRTGLPAVIVPKANLPGDHQVANALAARDAGCGRVVFETIRAGGERVETVDGEELRQAVLDVLRQPADGRTAGWPEKNPADQCADYILVGVPAGVEQRPVQPENRTGPARFFGASGDTLVRRVHEARAIGLDPESEAYLRYRCDGYLSGADWESVNTGVKLAGALAYRDRARVLLPLIAERVDRSFPLSLLLGPWRHPGFVRRNVLTALREIGVWGPKIETTVFDLLAADDYFEVRREGLRLLDASHGLVLDRERAASICASLAGSPRFEVACAAIEALARFDGGARLTLLDRFRHHPNWKVRRSLLTALDRMHVRGIVSAGEVRAFLDDFLVTATGFTPTFDLKVALKGLVDRTRGERDDV